MGLSHKLPPFVNGDTLQGIKEWLTRFVDLFQSFLNKFVKHTHTGLLDDCEKLTVASLTPPGSDTQVIFNDGGSLGADSGITYNKTTDLLTVTNLTVTTALKNTALTATRVPYASTAGLLVDSANLTFDGTNLSIVAPTSPLHAATKAYVDLAVSSLQLNEYFSSTASSYGGIYYVMDDTPAAAGTVVSASISADSTVNVFNFATTAGHPHIDRLVAGNYDIHAHLKKTGVKAVTCYCELYKRTTGDVETLLGTSASTTALTTSDVFYDVYMTIATEVAIDVTDRLVLKWYGVFVGAASGTTVTMTVGGTADPHLSIAINPLELDMIFIPYTGATADVNLGTYDLAAVDGTFTGNLTAGNAAGDNHLLRGTTTFGTGTGTLYISDAGNIGWGTTGTIPANYFSGSDTAVAYTGDTFTFNSNVIVATGVTLKVTDLTATRVLIAGASGLLTDSADLTFASSILNTHALTVHSFTTAGILHNAATTGIISSSLIVAADVTGHTLTYATIQEVSATSRVLGRISAGAGDIEELTAANLKTICGYYSALTDMALASGSIYVGNVSNNPAATAAANLVGANGLNSLSYASASFVKMTGANTFTLDTNTYLTAVTAHNLLSTTHGDTTAAAVARGDIIIGSGATPKWVNLAKGTADYILKMGADEPAWGTIATNSITDAAVTYAKMQHVSDTSRVLGRITAGAGDVEELTAANLKTICGYYTSGDSPSFATETLSTSLKIKETGAGTHYHIFQGGAITPASDLTWTLPIAYPASSGMLLSSTDAGVLSWASALTSTLSSAHIFIGNVSNVATELELSGDVTMDNAGAVTIGAEKVTYAKMQHVSATSRVLGRIAAGAGDVEELTGANIRTVIGANNYVSSFTRTVSTASGTQAITGLGFTPTSITFESGSDGGAGYRCTGMDNGTTHKCWVNSPSSSNWYYWSTYSIVAYDGAGTNYYYGYVSSLDADGFTITWTKVGTGGAAGTLTIIFTAFR